MKFMKFSLVYYIYWYTISTCNAWLIMHTMAHLIELSEKRRKRLLLLVSCFVLSCMVIFIGDPFNILTTIPFFLAAVLLTCKGSFWKKITIGLMFVSIVFSFNALRDNYLYAFIRPSAFAGFDQIIPGVVSCLFSSFLYIGIGKFAPDQDYELSDSMWKLLLLLTATPVGVVLSVVVLFNSYDDAGFASIPSHYEYAALLTIALLSFISLLWCVTVLARQRKLEQQGVFMEINRKYYESLEQQQFEIRRLKHDLANHLQVLSALPEEQRDAYIRDLTENTAVTQPLSYCGDATVNAVLSVKKNLMARYGIRMEMSVDIPKELPFDKTDICALYANALDNAAEACMKLEETRRAVTLKSTAQKGLLCLEVSNPIPDTAGLSDSPSALSGALQSGHIPPTSKTDKTNHGYGLKGMKEIVERYHGKMELDSVDGVFDLFLYIPLR